MSYFEQMRISDGTSTADIDSITSHLIIIASDHHEVHEGDSYTLSDTQSVDTTTQNWMITTPDTSTRAHMTFDIRCTGEVYILITEGADRAGSTALTKINRDRNSSNTSALTIHRGYSGGTTDGATTIFTIRDGTTGNGNKTLASGGNRGQNEFILKQNTKYIITVQTFDTVWVTVNLNWYEH